MKAEIHFLYERKFCRRPASEVIASEQSLHARLLLNVLCWCASEARKYSIGSAIVISAAMTSCSTAILAAKSILQIVHL